MILGRAPRPEVPPSTACLPRCKRAQQVHSRARSTVCRVRLERVDKVLSNMGMCTRREVTKLLRNQIIEDNGERIRSGSEKVRRPTYTARCSQAPRHWGRILTSKRQPRFCANICVVWEFPTLKKLLVVGGNSLSGLQVDRYTLTIDGEPLEHPGNMLVLLHKPCGYTCSKTASEGPLVYDLLPYTWLARKPPIATIGRCAGRFSLAKRCSSVDHFVCSGTSGR